MHYALSPWPKAVFTNSSLYLIFLEKRRYAVTAFCPDYLLLYFVNLFQTKKKEVVGTKTLCYVLNIYYFNSSCLIILLVLC